MPTHAELCPICKGSGKQARIADVPSQTATPLICEQSCHGCSGTGWIHVTDPNEQRCTNSAFPFVICPSCYSRLQVEGTDGPVIFNGVDCPSCKSHIMCLGAAWQWAILKK